MVYIFISYSRIDKDYASKIINVLEKLHINFFLDEKDIEWGGDISDVIEKTLADKVTHIIVIVSPASIKSHWVSYEVGYAKALGVKILPFLTHQSIDMPLFLSRYNYLSNIEQLERYFVKKIPEKEPLIIVNEEGVEEQVELIVCFQFNDTKDEYAVYTKNEYDNSGNITVYISSVFRDIEKQTVSLGSVSEEEWPRVKSVIKKLAEDDTNNFWEDVNIYDAKGTEIL